MRISVGFIKSGDKVKMLITFSTNSIGSFTIDTAYRKPSEILEQFKALHDEFVAVDGIEINTNGIIIDEENSSDTITNQTERSYNNA